MFIFLYILAYFVTGLLFTSVVSHIQPAPNMGSAIVCMVIWPIAVIAFVVTFLVAIFIKVEK